MTPGSAVRLASVARHVTFCTKRPGLGWVGGWNHWINGWMDLFYVHFISEIVAGTETLFYQDIL